METAKEVISVIQRCTNLISLRCSKIKCIDDTVIQPLTAVATQLRELDLSGTKVSVEALSNFIPLCTSLCALGLPQDDTTIASIIAMNCTNLEELHLPKEGKTTNKV